MVGSAGAYFTENGCKLAAILEMPYFGHEGCRFTQENTRIFGRNLGRAIKEYLI
jgi:hypothetical protein